MGDTNERDEFEKKFPPPIGTTYNVYHDQYDTCDEHGELCNQSYTSDYRIWQAATASSDARYQARVRELEEALYEISIRCVTKDIRREIAHKALSTTTPDTALQRKVLEARIDEICMLKINGSYSGSIEQDLTDRIEELRKQRRILNLQDSTGSRSLLKDAVVVDSRTATREELQRGVQQARRLRGEG